MPREFADSCYVCDTGTYSSDNATSCNTCPSGSQTIDHLSCSPCSAGIRFYNKINITIHVIMVNSTWQVILKNEMMFPFAYHVEVDTIQILMAQLNVHHAGREHFQHLEILLALNASQVKKEEKEQ